MMFNLCFKIVTAVVLVGTSFKCFAIGEEVQASPTPINIGMIIPLTGDAAVYGISVKNGFLLAQKERPGVPLKLSLEDDGFTPARGIAALRKLNSSTDKPAVIIVGGSQTANAIAPIAENDGFPHVAIATDSQVSLGRRMSFNFWVTPKAQCERVAQEAVRRGYKSIASIATTHQGSLTIRDSCIEALKKVGINQSLGDEFSLESRDFRSFITRLKSSQTDALFVVLLPGQLASFAQQLSQAKWQKPIFGIDALESPEDVKAARGSLDGAWYANAPIPSQDFLRRYSAEFPDASAYAAHTGYDTYLLLQAVLASGKRGVALADEIRNVKNIEGMQGTFSSLGDGTFSIPAVLKIIKDGNFMPLE